MNYKGADEQGCSNRTLRDGRGATILLQPPSWQRIIHLVQIYLSSSPSLSEMWSVCVGSVTGRPEHSRKLRAIKPL
ncbi:unnamed protein product [Staurois parvus]|uniref:Uncharacterized protein n=1 Tax=Staurois parvus TaxID=386267 RepID=A0ABN9GCY6_9NEOB|nr:unnamed protein product [Staurois parvus]